MIVLENKFTLQYEFRVEMLSLLASSTKANVTAGSHGLVLCD